MNDIVFLTIPDVCPYCGGVTSIEISESGVKNLICSNPACTGKLINRLDHFCGTKGLNILGISRRTLTRYVTTNKIKAEKGVNGRYKYNKESVINLLK